MSTITFTREALDRYIIERDNALSGNRTHFIWKGSLVHVLDATILIDKLKKSNNLSITL